MKVLAQLLWAVVSSFGIYYSMAEKIRPKPKYLVITPTLVRPSQTVLISVSIYDMPQAVHVHAGITCDYSDVTSTSQLFHPGSTGNLQLQMPDSAAKGQYRLWVKGSLDPEGRTTFFQNETKVIFQQKHVSVFLHLDKAFYQKRNRLKFRLIAVTPTLMPVKFGSVTLYMRDGKGRIIHRFFAQQLLNGVYEDYVDLSHPVFYSKGWSLQVEGWGYKYKKLYFDYENNFIERLDMNISCPPYVKDDEYAVSGLITVNQTSGMPVVGNATIELEIQPPGQKKNFPVLKEVHGYFSGVTSFLFPLSEIKRHTSNLTGTRLSVRATVQDYHILERKTLQRKTWILGSHVKLRFIGGKTRVFKPGTPLNIWIAVHHVDGSKLSYSSSRQVYISVSVKTSTSATYGKEERPLIVPDDSIVKYTYTPPGDSAVVTIRASFGEKLAPETLVATRRYSPSEKFLTVSTSTTRPEADRYMVFTVRSNAFLEKLDYLIMSRGEIMVANSLFLKSRQKTFSVALSRDMAPLATIFIYGVAADGEVLTDSLAFHIGRQSTTQMSLNINLGKDLSRNTVELSTQTEPGTYVAFSAVPYELYKAGANREEDGNLFFTTYSLEEELSTYSKHVNISASHTWYLGDNRRANVYFPTATSAIDANTTFAFAGLIVYTDAHVPRQPAVDQLCNVTRGSLACFSSGCYDIKDACNGAWQCEDGADEMGCPEPAYVSRPNEYYQETRLWSHLDDTSWAWKHYYTKPDGRLDLKLKLPLRPRTWVVGGFALSLDSGLIFVEEPARVLVTLKASNKYDFVNIGESSGYTSSYAPRTTPGIAIQTMVYMEAQQSKYIHIPILPKVLGKIKVTVHVESFIGKQSLSKSVTISMDGVTNYYHSTYFIDLINHGALVLPNMDIPIREMFVHPDNPYHYYVPGSQKAVVSLVGDVMGPGFFKPYITQDSILDMKEGHGETYLFNFAYNVLWLKFLRVTDQTTEATVTGALRGCDKNFHSICAYMQKNGCFAMRRKRAGCSTWLTAYALEALSEASETEWQDYLFIDTNILNELASYLITVQDKTSGVFYDKNKLIYDNKLQSPTSNSTNLTTTAYAIIALSKSVSKLTGPVRSKAKSSAQEGSSYLAKHLLSITDTFELCLVAYALTVSGHSDKDVAFHLVKKRARIGEYVYWSPVEIPPIPTELIQTVPYLKAKPLAVPFESMAIQATSYALMVYLRHNLFEEAIPIVTWLQTRRSTDSAFNGPQDTVAAIRALKEFGESINNRQLFNMLVQLEVTSAGEWKRSMHLHNGSLTDYMTAKVPVAWGSVRPKVQGTGYALLQLSSQVNVEYPFLMRQPSVRSFDLTVDDLYFTGRNASIMFMNVCMRWVRTDLYPRSGAAVLLIDIPTGFFVRKNLIRRQRRLVRIPAHRPRFTSQQVVLYFDYIDDQKSCFKFYGERWYPVANASIQHKIRIIDTYEPAFQNTTLYNTYSLHHLHICQVCGSFQCPYCPYYNAASEFRKFHGLYIVTLLLILMSVPTWNLHIPLFGLKEDFSFVFPYK